MRRKSRGEIRRRRRCRKKTRRKIFVEDEYKKQDKNAVGGKLKSNKNKNDKVMKKERMEEA